MANMIVEIVHASPTLGTHSWDLSYRSHDYMDVIH